jgi:hypothetical protein
METILNLLWLVVTLGIFGVWSSRWLPARRHRQVRALHEGLALLCALALLFPAVSLTDDLHPQIVAVDASAGKRNAYQLVANSSHARVAAGKSLHRRISIVAVLPLGLAHSDLAAGDLLRVSGSVSVSARNVSRRDRSPPAHSLAIDFVMARA